jgi:hypothetical protein
MSVWPPARVPPPLAPSPPRRMPRSASLAASVLALASLVAGCAPEVQDLRMGVARPGRPPTCDLDVVTADATMLSKYEQVGVIQLSNAPGDDPLSAEARDQVRPRACALGGDAISVMASGNVGSRVGIHVGTFRSYVVWAKKSRASSPQKF